MKLTMVASPVNEDNLKLIRQLGVASVVHYDMRDAGPPLEALRRIERTYRDAGLDWVVSESGPPIDRIVLGLDGWEAQTEAYKRSVVALAECGVRVIAYNFMPQLGYDAMVVRTTYDHRTRGGARTSAFDLAAMPSDNALQRMAPVGKARLWQNLERFLEAVLPVAEEAGVRLAMHPDDPPVLAANGRDRIMSTVDDFDRLLRFSDSPANGITLCVGCFAEMGAEAIAVARRFKGRFPFVHIRNVAGEPSRFEERFIDDGDIDMVAVFTTLHETGFDGYIRSDHTPVLVTESGRDAQEGYGMQGHIHAVGYIQGLIAATARLSR